MPGFPGAAIGAGLGLGAEQIQKQRQQELVAQQMQAYLQNMQRQQKLESDKDQASAALFGAISTGGLDGGGQQPQSLGLPGSQYVQPPPGSGMKSGLPNLGNLSFDAGLQKLTSMGVNPEVARGAIAYMQKNESGNNPLAVNQTSGALGRGQWLGPRKQALVSQFGAQPSDQQQAEFMGSELQGPENRVLRGLLSGKTAQDGYNIWGRDFERPGAAALAKAGVTGQMAPGGAATAGSRNAQGGAPATFRGNGVEIIGPQSAVDRFAGPQQSIDPKQLIQSAPPEMQQASQQAAQTAASGIPQQLFGRMSLQSLAQAIDKANPNLPASVKGMALIQAMPLLARDQGPELQLMMHMLNRREALDDQEHRDKRDDLKTAAQEARADQSKWTVLTDPKNDQQYAYNPVTKQATTLTGEPYTPGGAARMGSGATPAAGEKFNESQKTFWANVLRNGGHLPPGLARTKEGSMLVQEIMRLIPGGGGSGGDFIANASTVKADDKSLANMVKMTDAATSFEKTANKNFDTAMRLAKDAIPTDLGPFFNRWIETGQTQFGDLNVPPYVTALLTAANEYAKIMQGSTGAQGATVSARREATEMFSPYLSNGQIDRVVAVAKQDMQNRKDALYGQVDEIKQRLRSAGSGEPTASQGQGRAAGATPSPAAAPTAAAAPAGGMPKVSSQEAYDALPSGAHFIGPDGQERAKP